MVKLALKSGAYPLFPYCKIAFDFCYLHLASILCNFLTFSLLWLACICTRLELWCCFFSLIAALHWFSHSQNFSCVGFPGHYSWGDYMILWLYKFINFSFHLFYPHAGFASYCWFHDSNLGSCHLLKLIILLSATLIILFCFIPLLVTTFWQFIIWKGSTHFWLLLLKPTWFSFSFAKICFGGLRMSLHCQE